MQEDTKYVIKFVFCKKDGSQCAHIAKYTAVVQGWRVREAVGKVSCAVQLCRQVMPGCIQPQLLPDHKTNTNTTLSA